MCPETLSNARQHRAANTVSGSGGDAMVWYQHSIPLSWTFAYPAIQSELGYRQRKKETRSLRALTRIRLQQNTQPLPMVNIVESEVKR